jgi:hypothetical protein
VVQKFKKTEYKEGLRRAMALGNTVPLPNLFATAGLSFSITPELLQELVQFIDDELTSLGGLCIQ